MEALPQDECGEDESRENPHEIRKCYPRRNVILVSICCCSLSVLLIPLVISAIVASVEMSVIGDDVNTNATEWPVRNADGLVLPYKNSHGRWVNWWSRDRYGAFSFLSRIWLEKDNSSIPSIKSQLDGALPVRRPSWAGNGSVEAKVGEVKATWLGHATVLAQVDGAVVLADPIFSQRASAVQWAGPKRYRPPACNVSELPDNLHAVVISHDHYDHLDYNSVNDLNSRFGDRLHWFVPQDLGSWFTGNFGINASHVHELKWWEEKALPNVENVKIVALPSNHWCRRGLFDENKALWASWAVIGATKRFWFGGDTAYAPCFEQIGDRYGPFDLAAVPIGAYEPRWFMKFVHVNPEEAVCIHKDINSKRSFGIHWGTFKLTYEHYLEPRVLTKRIVKKLGMSDEEFQVINMGESVQGE